LSLFRAAPQPPPVTREPDRTSAVDQHRGQSGIKKSTLRYQLICHAKANGCGKRVM
jgi:hypothetical protein